ncbi:hypothetical protein E2986_04814 [Frieseomelitta varia]|uniref:Uncharacterized protein n=1 Tax=Frieseomelitta varia TaxID=561572 RepID=A0A833SB84_9HYME|nr:hypothetical protein E2986_04814 [Frieseomelitta varia]
MSESQSKKVKMSSLAQLKEITTIVADTGDFQDFILNSCMIKGEGDYQKYRKIPMAHFSFII